MRKGKIRLFALSSFVFISLLMAGMPSMAQQTPYWVVLMKADGKHIYHSTCLAYAKENRIRASRLVNSLHVENILEDVGFAANRIRNHKDHNQIDPAPAQLDPVARAGSI